jgi:hypothetical protein
MAGADIHTVAQILGHKDSRMAARYQISAQRRGRFLFLLIGRSILDQY